MAATFVKSRRTIEGGGDWCLAIRCTSAANNAAKHVIMRTADINESTKGAVPVPGKRSKVANNHKVTESAIQAQRGTLAKGGSKAAAINSKKIDTKIALVAVEWAGEYLCSDTVHSPIL